MGDPLDFKYLAKVLDANRGNAISDGHWENAKKQVISNSKRLAEIEKATVPSREDLDSPFNI